MLMFALTVLSFASTSDDAAAGVVGVFLIILLLILGLVFYFLPTVIAIFRNHHQWAAITIINLFFGWTFVGWVVALAWSVSAARER